MKDTTRERLATGAVGAGLVGAGAHYRDRAVKEATAVVGKPAPRVGYKRLKMTLSDVQLVRARGMAAHHARGLYGAGALLGAAGTPALASALHREKVAKASNLLETGLEGTASAYKAKQEHKRSTKGQKTPKKVQAFTAAAGLGAGAGAAHLSDRAFKVIEGAGKHVRPSAFRVPARGVAGVAGVTATVPLVNRALHRTEYEVTPNGVRRKKTAPKPPSSKAMSYEGRASRGADPRAYRMNTVAKRTWTDDEMDDMAADDAIDIKGLRHADTYAHWRPILAKRRAWYRRNGLHDHADDLDIALRQADKDHRVKKSDPGGADLHIQSDIARRKRRQARLSTTSGVLGLTGLGLLAAKKTAAATKTGIVAGGVGGVNALYGAHAARKEAQAIERPVRKDLRMPFLPGMDAEKLPIHNVAHGLWRSA